jgi:hypothetical protein
MNEPAVVGPADAVARSVPQPGDGGAGSGEFLPGRGHLFDTGAFEHGLVGAQDVGGDEGRHGDQFAADAVVLAHGGYEVVDVDRLAEDFGAAGDRALDTRARNGDPLFVPVQRGLGRQRVVLGDVRWVPRRNGVRHLFGQEVGLDPARSYAVPRVGVAE